MLGKHDFFCAVLLGLSVSLAQEYPVPGALGIILAVGSYVVFEFRRKKKQMKESQDDLAGLSFTRKERENMRLEIFETNYGHTAGWYVENGGR